MSLSLLVWKHPPKCNNFLQFSFSDKVVITRALIPTTASYPSGPVPCQAVFEKFAPVTLSLYEDVVGHIKPSGSPCDGVPPTPTFLREFSLV